MNNAASDQVISRIDHLVVVADGLPQGAAWCEATFGVLPGMGGHHALMATHNLLLPIGGPDWPQAYLEIIAIDPEAEWPTTAGRSRWFGMDDPALRAAVRLQPRLVHFVAQTADVHSACAALAACGEDVGRPVSASRATPQGELRWQITLRDDGVPQHGGGLPALIEWQGTHPSASMPTVGIELLGFCVQATRPEYFRRACSAIGLQGLQSGSASLGSATVLEARFATPRGEILLAGSGV